MVNKILLIIILILMLSSCSNNKIYNNILSDDIVKELHKNDWEIIIIDELPAPEGYIANGAYYHNEKKIYIKNSPDMEYHLLHELGHYLYNNKLDAADKQVIADNFIGQNVNIISKALSSNYCKTNQEEFFAEFVEYSLLMKNKGMEVDNSLKDLFNILIKYKLYKE